MRRQVADRLGVAYEELTPGVSLRDDLAADSLDLVELILALEAEFASAFPATVVDQLRTFGELLLATESLIRVRRTAEGRRAETPELNWTASTQVGSA